MLADIIEFQFETIPRNLSLEGIPLMKFPSSSKSKVDLLLIHGFFFFLILPIFL